MPTRGRYNGSRWGADEAAFGIIEQGSGTLAMAPLNTGCAFRFSPPDARDIASVWISWSTVASPGAFTMRIETDTSGKPSGTLVDANALATGVTPTAGAQQVTLGATPWSSHMSQGSDYYVVILTTTGGTTQTIRRSLATAGSLNHSPFSVLTAADGTTRTNFAEVASAQPTCSLVFADGSEELLGFNAYGTADNTFFLFGTAGGGLKFSVPGNKVLKVAGVEFTGTKVGTPAGDLRVRILDSTDTAVTGTTLTLKSTSLGSAGTRRCLALFPAVVTLTAGTYRAVFDSASSVNSSNCWQVSAGVARVAGLIPSGFAWSTTADDSVAHPSWTDTTTKMPAVSLLLDDSYGPFLNQGA